MMEQISTTSLQRLNYSPGEPQDLVVCGSLEYYDKVRHRACPVVLHAGNVWALDMVPACIFAAVRSVGGGRVALAQGRAGWILLGTPARRAVVAPILGLRQKGDGKESSAGSGSSNSRRSNSSSSGSFEVLLSVMDGAAASIQIPTAPRRASAEAACSLPVSSRQGLWAACGAWGVQELAGARSTGPRWWRFGRAGSSKQLPWGRGGTGAWLMRLASCVPG